MFCQASSVPQGSRRSHAAPRSTTAQEPFSLNKSCLEFAPAVTVVLKESLVPRDWGGPGCGIWGGWGKVRPGGFTPCGNSEDPLGQVCLSSPFPTKVMAGLKVELNLKLGFIGCSFPSSVIPVVPPEPLCLLSPLCTRGSIYVKQSRKMGDSRLVPVLVHPAGGLTPSHCSRNDWEFIGLFPWEPLLPKSCRIPASPQGMSLTLVPRFV